jgi:hypothetical protein
LPIPFSTVKPVARVLRAVLAVTLSALEQSVQAGSRANAWAALRSGRVGMEARTPARSAAEAVMRAGHETEAAR